MAQRRGTPATERDCRRGGQKHACMSLTPQGDAPTVSCEPMFGWAANAPLPTEGRLEPLLVDERVGRQMLGLKAVVHRGLRVPRRRLSLRETLPHLA